MPSWPLSRRVPPRPMQDYDCEIYIAGLAAVDAKYKYRLDLLAPNADSFALDESHSDKLPCIFVASQSDANLLEGCKSEET